MKTEQEQTEANNSVQDQKLFPEAAREDLAIRIKAHLDVFRRGSHQQVVRGDIFKLVRKMHDLEHIDAFVTGLRVRPSEVRFIPVSSGALFDVVSGKFIKQNEVLHGIMSGRLEQNRQEE